jgi:hypothetical protein
MPITTRSGGGVPIVRVTERFAPVVTGKDGSHHMICGVVACDWSLRIPFCA